MVDIEKENIEKSDTKEQYSSQELTPADFKKAAKFAQNVWKKLEESSKKYHTDAKSKWWKHYNSIPVRSNIDDDVLSQVFVDETYKACDRLSTRFKGLSPTDSDKFDYRFIPGGLDSKGKLNNLKSCILNDLRLMKYPVEFCKSMENYCVEGTAWHKLEWDMSTDLKRKITSKKKKVFEKVQAEFPDNSISEVPKESEIDVFDTEFYEEARDRGKLVVCRYDRIFVDVDSGENLENTDLAFWVTTDFEELEKSVYNKETGEGKYHNVSKLKTKIYETLSEEEALRKVPVELIELWASYDYSGEKKPELCRIIISKDHPDICLSVDPDPYMLGHKPFYKAVLYRRNGKQLGKGIPEMVWNAQVQLNDAMTLLYENSALRGFGMGFYSMTAGLTNKQLRMRPRKMIPVSDPNNAYFPIKFDDVSVPMLRVSEIWRKDIVSHSGVSESLGGEADPSVDTAHEFERLLQLSSDKIKDYLRNVEANLIEPFLNDYILLLFSNWDDYSKRLFPVIGEESAGVQEFVRNQIFSVGYENIRFECKGAMRMEHDAVTNKRIFDTYTVFKDDGTIPPSGKWKMKAAVLKSLHPDISQKEIEEALGPMPEAPKQAFVPPMVNELNKGGMNQQSMQNQPADLNNLMKGAIQTPNISNEGTGQ